MEVLTLKQKFVGQRVLVKNIDTPFEKNTSIGGICTSIGYNPLLNVNQVVIGRTPLTINSFNQVSLQNA